MKTIKRNRIHIVTWLLIVTVLVVVLSQKISFIWAVEQTVMWKDVFLPTFQAAASVITIMVSDYLLGRKVDAVKTAVDTLSGKLSSHRQPDDCDDDCTDNPTQRRRDRAEHRVSDLVGLVGAILAIVNTLFFTFLFTAEAGNPSVRQLEVLLIAGILLLLPALSGVLSYRYRRKSFLLALVYSSTAMVPWIMILVFLVFRYYGS